MRTQSYLPKMGFGPLWLTHTRSRYKIIQHVAHPPPRVSEPSANSRPSLTGLLQLLLKLIFPAPQQWYGASLSLVMPLSTIAVAQLRILFTLVSDYPREESQRDLQIPFPRSGSLNFSNFFIIIIIIIIIILCVHNMVV